MKICYIFREKERKAHSIELLFNKISEEVAHRDINVQKWYKPLSNLKAIFSLRKLNADIYHITGDCYYLSLFLPWKKTVMTIHDIGMYKNHKKTFKSRLFALVSFILPLKVLKVSTVISELTKNDLVNILGINPQKLQVIPNPLVLPIEYSPKDFNSNCPVILQIGSGDHKNLIGLIEGIKDIRCHLEIVGNPSDFLINKMKEYKIQYSISKQISNEEIITKYKNCDLLYFASLSEGFGLPILEAQKMGRPVITSKTEPTNWVCGKGGILVDPYNISEIRDAVLSIKESANLRGLLIKEGLENIERFNIQEIVSEYCEVYKKMTS